jgi:L,D-peptidoglycan transpeptidase YkuD (ErfK/YbiS/YcfS/YnhG family)
LIVKPGASKSYDSLPTFWKENLEKNVPFGSNQVLLVIGNDPASATARVYFLEKVKGSWRPVYGPVDAMAGRSGFVLSEEKREGDCRTPTGIYPLEFAFGYAPRIPTKMAYRQATDGDIWVDDIESPDYNKWVTRGNDRNATSCEQMRRQDDLYMYGIVVGYNRNPVVKGRGSAIFFHVWKGPTKPTAGCIAMSEYDLVAILSGLDPSQRPVAVVGTAQRLK